MKSPDREPLKTNHSLAALFQSIADLLEIRRENPHRIKAYRRAAETLLDLNEDIGAVAERGALRQLPGIGRDLSAKIEEFLKTDKVQAYDELNIPLPPEVATWTQLPGLSEGMVHYLYVRLGIRTLSDLASLVRSHLLRTLPRITASEEELLAAIETHKAEAQSRHSSEPEP